MYKKTKIFQNVYLYNYYENNVLISDYVMYKEYILGNFYFKKENDVIEYSCLSNYKQIGMKITIDEERFSICTINKNEEEIGKSLVYNINNRKIVHNVISIDGKWYFEKNLEIIEKNKDIIKKVLFLKKAKIIIEEKIWNKNIVDFKLFINNNLTGFREIKDTNGNLLLRGSYLDGKKVGLWYEYENEKVVFKVSFDEKERLCGLCKEYNLDGKIIAEEIYIKGKLIKRIEKKFL